jgi:SAM-dependent methyltransferase
MAPNNTNPFRNKTLSSLFLMKKTLRGNCVQPGVGLEMHITEATNLIRSDKILRVGAQTWCDLGSGTGTFTLALARLLAPGSIIHAIDQNEGALAQIPDHHQEVTIRKQVMKLDDTNLSLPSIDGVLMANFLHYIEDPGALLRKLRSLSSRLLIVEYEGREANQWVPYPLNFCALRELVLEQGFGGIVKVRTRPSRFGGQMYSAFAE